MKRREFLESAALAALAGGCLSRRRGTHAPAEQETPDVSRREPLRVAVIGAGGQGFINVQRICATGDEIVALCDVDETALASALDFLASRRGIRTYRDFRVLFERERDLDAVFIATPDHGHALQVQWALERKIPVYVEPPLARTLAETRRLHTLARAARVPLWLGIQGRTAKEFHRAEKCLATGMLGNLHTVTAWTNRPVWPQGIQRPEGTDPIPASLDWNLWLGSAPVRPYREGFYHAFNWRGWRDFGTGALGDSGCHLFLLPFTAAKIPPPSSVACLQGSVAGESYPRATHVRFNCAGKKRGWFRRKQTLGVTIDWYDGGLKPEGESFAKVAAAFNGKFPASGCLLQGENGIWLSAGLDGREQWLALGNETQLRQVEMHPACREITGGTRNIPLQRVFLNALRMKMDDILADGCPVAMLETILCGCVAQQMDTDIPLFWNTGENRFEKNFANFANAFVDQPLREGW
ncbi:MAG: Gfo/Idh/MocA family oxidoreductase [Kiritimatiellae bacterium]|nr:Gfo/Idh/MocA family oxidoreductase [Kiritimatiellia bacterium]